MVEGIFHDACEAYWEKSIPVIPLRKRKKSPFFNDWQQYCRDGAMELIDPDWKTQYADCNIGLPLGPGSKIAIVDVDTDDERVEKLVIEIAGPSPWRRVGRKGCALAYKWTPTTTTRRIPNLMDILSTGSQVVLPPSIHPDTNEPYVSDTYLPDVVDQLLPMPDDFMERITKGLADLGYVEAAETLKTKSPLKLLNLVPHGARNSTMTAMAGLHASAVVRGERTAAEALDIMRVWVEEFVEEQSIDDGSISVGLAQQRMSNFLIRDIERGNKSLPAGWDEGLDDETRKYFDDTTLSQATRKSFDEIEIEINGFGSRKSLSPAKWLDQIMTWMAQSSGDFSAMEIDQLCGQIRTVMKDSNPPTKKLLRDELARKRAGDFAGLSHGEVVENFARLLAESGEVIFDKGSFRQWTGAAWIKQLPESYKQRMLDEYRDVPAMKKAGDYKGALDLLGTHLAKEPDQCQGFNFLNGWVTSEGELVEHDPRYGANYYAPYSYRPELAGKCPLFFGLLEKAWGHEDDYEDRLLCLQEMFGITMFGAGPAFEKAFCLFGPGGTSKSTVLNILQALLPKDQVTSLPPHNWGHRFISAELDGTLLNVCGELSEDKAIPGDIFKKVVSGEKMLVEHKNKTPFHIFPACTNWFASNYLPRTKDQSTGFLRRWIFLPFEKVLAEREQIKNYHDLIVDNEDTAIAAWAVEGFLRAWQRQSITTPASHRRLIEQMRSQNNNVARWFFMEKPAANKRTYTDYQAYTFISNGKPVTEYEFETRMKDLVQ